MHACPRLLVVLAMPESADMQSSWSVSHQTATLPHNPWSSAAGDLYGWGGVTYGLVAALDVPTLTLKTSLPGQKTKTVIAAPGLCWKAFNC